MFTGLVQDLGRLGRIQPAGQSIHLEIQTRLAGDLVLGDSLAVNGVCLTVSAVRPDLVVATAIPETLSRTTLGKLTPGDLVNLEPALRLGDRMGGHLVQGHVDGLGRITQLNQRGLSLEMTVAAAQDILRYVVHKGSITIDGTSLTVAALTEKSFSVALIPHTLAVTVLAKRKIGDRVNLEVDILAKYVERMLAGSPTQGKNAQSSENGQVEASLGIGDSAEGRSATEEETPQLTEAFLRRHGFM